MKSRNSKSVTVINGRELNIYQPRVYDFNIKA